jgi:subtilase family serine protease
VAAAGDSGSEDCFDEAHGATRTSLAVDDPASQPFVTGVGGTTLQSVGPPATEAVWNNQGGAGGGGLSSLESMPSYQSAAPKSLGVGATTSGCDAAGGTCREVPDVSANAGAPLAIYCTMTGTDGCAPDGWTGVYGTSVSAPTWGAFVALANASPACNGRPIGFANSALYVVAASSGHASALNDVTQGNNDLGFHSGLYAATTGYDLASGLGTPIAGTGSGTDGGLATRLCATARALAAPGVSKLAPAAGPTRGATKVTITGSNLGAVAAVKFGNLQASSFTLVSNTKLVAVAPPGRGTATVTLATYDGTAHGTKAFRYVVMPSVRAVRPASGRSGARVTLTGTSFVDVTAVRFGSRAARSFSVASPTKIVAAAPAGAGTVPVTVVTPGGTSANTAVARFRYTG